MAFPTSLDSLKSTWLPGERPIGHAAHHNSMAILLYAIQSKVGINGSADTSSLDYKVTALASGPWLDFTPTASVIQSIEWARYKRESKKVFINIKMTVNVTSGFEFAFSGLPVATTTNHTVLQVRIRQGFGSTIYGASAEPSGTSSMYVSVHSPLTSFPSGNWDVYISGFYEIA